MDASAWIGIGVGVIISVIGYLLHHLISGVDEDLKAVKSSQYVTNERLARIETTQDNMSKTVADVSSKNLKIEAEVIRTKFLVEQNSKEILDQAKKTDADLQVQKSNFGKVILILKKLILVDPDKRK